MTNLTDLLLRVEEGDGADQELDGVITFEVADGFYDGVDGWRVPGFDGPRRTPPEFTASLDVALALVERLRRDLKCYGWQVELDDEPVHHPYYGSLFLANNSPAYRKAGYRDGGYHADGATPARAMLAALLKALIAKENEHVG